MVCPIHVVRWLPSTLKRSSTRADGDWRGGLGTGRRRGLKPRALEERNVALNLDRGHGCVCPFLGHQSAPGPRSCIPPPSTPTMGGAGQGFFGSFWSEGVSRPSPPCTSTMCVVVELHRCRYRAADPTSAAAGGKNFPRRAERANPPSFLVLSANKDYRCRNLTLHV